MSVTTMGQTHELARPGVLDGPAGAARLARMLEVWDRLGLELGEAAVVSGSGPAADGYAWAAALFGAAPVLRLGQGAEGVGRFVPSGDEEVRVATLRGLLPEGVPVAAVELSGHAEAVDLLLEALPTFGRIALAGRAAVPLTVDYYNNFHRKGLRVLGFELGADGLGPPDGSGTDPHWLERARRLLADPGRPGVFHAP